MRSSRVRPIGARKLTKYTGGAYTDGTTLVTPMLGVTTLSSGVGVPVTPATVSTTAATIATGLGLGTDVYGLTLSQTTLITDSPTTYRNDLTYTAAATL